MSGSEWLFPGEIVFIRPESYQEEFLMTRAYHYDTPPYRAICVHESLRRA